MCTCRKQQQRQGSCTHKRINNINLRLYKNVFEQNYTILTSLSCGASDYHKKQPRFASVWSKECFNSKPNRLGCDGGHAKFQLPFQFQPNTCTIFKHGMHGAEFFQSTTLLPIKNVQNFYKKIEIQKGPLIGMFFLNTRLLSTVVSAHGAAEVKCRLSGVFFSVDVPPPNPVLQTFGRYRERITFEHGLHARYATLQLFHHDLCV